MTAWPIRTLTMPFSIRTPRPLLLNQSGRWECYTTNQNTRTTARPFRTLWKPLDQSNTQTATQPISSLETPLLTNQDMPDQLECSEHHPTNQNTHKAALDQSKDSERCLSNQNTRIITKLFSLIFSLDIFTLFMSWTFFLSDTDLHMFMLMLWLLSLIYEQLLMSLNQTPTRIQQSVSTSHEFDIICFAKSI